MSAPPVSLVLGPEMSVDVMSMNAGGENYVGSPAMDAMLKLLDEAVRAHDAWGVVVQRGDCDLRLFGVDSLVLAARYGSTAWLVIETGGAL